MVAVKKTLHDKLVEVAAEVRNIEKGGTNEVQHYSFVQEADVVRKVWPEFIKRGLMFYPVHRRIGPIVEYANNKGGASFLTTVESAWRLTDGEDSITVASCGQGTDTGGDKGIYKALTGDKKYAVLQLLGIATGDDPENEPMQRSVASTGISDKQRDMLFALAKNAGFNPNDVASMNELGQTIFSLTNKRGFKELDNADVDKIVEELKKIEQQNKIVAVTGGTVVD